MIRLKAILGNKGFTLVELLVVLAITGIITMAATTVVIQLMTQGKNTSERLTAAQAVQNAGSWFKHDGVMAQAVTIDDSGAGATMVWHVWDGTEYRVQYFLDDPVNGRYKLKRSYRPGVSASAQLLTVAESVTSSVFTWNDQVIRMTVVAEVGPQTASRTYEAKPRPMN